MLTNLYNFILSELPVRDVFIHLAISSAIFLAFKLLSYLYIKKGSAIINRLFKSKVENFGNILAQSTEKPVSIFLVITGIYLAVVYFPFNIEIHSRLQPFLTRIYRICLILVISFSTQNFVKNIPLLTKNITDSKNKTLINFFVQVARVLVVAFTVLIIINEFGYDVNGLIAGLGLGGLTFALTAQDTASNFFAGVVILFDKPFAIGDWIAVGNIEGVVEEMHFRSSRIRTFDNALISVPNSKLSGESVTNWTKMNMRKTKFKIGLIYSTSPETIKDLCREIKAELQKYTEIKTDTILVWFDNFNTSSLDIVIQFHSFPIPLAEHTALREKVNFAIMDIVTKHNTDFAFETKTVFHKNI